MPTRPLALALALYAPPQAIERPAICELCHWDHSIGSWETPRSPLGSGIATTSEQERCLPGGVATPGA